MTHRLVGVFVIALMCVFTPIYAGRGKPDAPPQPPEFGASELKFIAGASVNEFGIPNIASLVILPRHQLVFRSAEELAAHCDPRFLDKKKATAADHAAALARRLKVKSIDWKTQMVIAVSAGQQGHVADVEIKNLTALDKVLNVHWKLNDSGDTALSHPRQVILVERFDGQVRFVPAPPGLPVRTLSRGGFAADFARPEHLVVRSDADWKTLLGRLAKGGDGPGKMPNLDFSKEMVVAVFRGKATQIQPRVEILQAEKRGTQIAVFFHEPDRGGRDEPPENQPFHIVVIPREEGKVVFQKIERPNK